MRYHHEFHSKRKQQPKILQVKQTKTLGWEGEVFWLDHLSISLIANLGGCSPSTWDVDKKYANKKIQERLTYSQFAMTLSREVSRALLFVPWCATCGCPLTSPVDRSATKSLPMLTSSLNPSFFFSYCFCSEGNGNMARWPGLQYIMSKPQSLVPNMKLLVESFGCGCARGGQSRVRGWVPITWPKPDPIPILAWPFGFGLQEENIKKGAKQRRFTRSINLNPNPR